MNSIYNRVKRRGKSLVSAILPAVPNKHADVALQHLRQWSSEDVVFDVGANDGRTILRIQHLLGSPRIYAFEPVSSAYQAMIERTKHLSNVRHFQLALGEAPGRQEIYVNQMASMSSFLPQWDGEEKQLGRETVEIRTIDQVMAEQEVDFIHFLKIDTEGFEMEVLKGAQEALSNSRIAVLQVEVGFDQMGRGYTSLEGVRRHLAPLGYLLYGIYNQCSTRAQVPQQWKPGVIAEEQMNVLAYCDALFVRADL